MESPSRLGPPGRLTATLPWRPLQAGRSMKRLTCLAIVAALLAGCGTVTRQPAAAGREPAKAATATVQRSDAMRPPGGALNPDVTQATIGLTICLAGWTATVRPATSYTNGVKAKLLREHGLHPSDADRFELDHLVPLALGGHPRSVENLWLQSWTGEWSARRKDQLEVRLKNMVCSGAHPLAEARRAIAADWHAAWIKYVGDGAREVDMEPVE